MIFDVDSKMCRKGKLLRDTRMAHSYLFLPTYTSENTLVMITGLVVISF